MKTKYIAMGVAVASLFALTSCLSKGNSADYSTLRQITVYEDDVKTTFGLFTESAEESKLVDATAKNTTYYNLYVAKDATASLFTYSYDLTDYFNSNDGERNSTVTVNTLTFEMQEKNPLYDEEKTAILSAAYNKDNGVDKVLNVNFTVTTSTDYSRTFESKRAYDAYKNGEEVSLAIVYLPVYVKHVVSDQPVLRAYVFLPVYATYVTASGKEVLENGELVDSTITGIKSIDLKDYFATTSGTLKGEKEIPVDPVTPDEPTENNGGLSAGAIVGIVIGGIFGILIVAYFLVGFTFWRSGILEGAFFKKIYGWIKQKKQVTVVKKK